MNGLSAVSTLKWRPTRRALLDSVPLVLICLLPIALFIPWSDNPFERDEGTYATVAQGLLDGDVPYRDLFDNKPPLVYGWYAFSFLLFGENVVAPRVLAAVLLSLTALTLFAQARAVFSRGVAYVATGLFAVATGLPFVALHANTEAYMLLPVVASLAVFTFGMRSGRLGWFLLAGALGGVAIMTKQVAVWNLLALAAVALAWRWRAAGTVPDRLAPLVFLAAGAAAALALFATPFFAMGALDDLLYANVSYNWLYVGFLSLGERVLDLAAGLAFVSAIAAPLGAGAVLGLAMVLKERRPAGYYLLVVWAVASAAGVATGGRFFPHYFLHLIPAMAVLTAIAVQELLLNRGSWSVRPAMLIGVGALVGVSLVVNGALYLAPWRTEKSVAPTIFEQKRWEEASREIGVYIAQRTTPEDTIFNLGREPQIYFYADRRPAVQYFYDWAYQYDETTISVTIEALRRERPAYIIDSIQPPLFEPGQRPPAFQKLLDDEYEYEGRLYFADLYRLRAAD
jgi:4-amino-4-deoxy-L-arabinose transferase-like glycosyltransferase